MIFDLSLTLGAMYAKTQIPDAPSEYGYFYYALQLLPHGLKGFFLAGITATVLSTLDSYLFLASTTISHDLLPKKYRKSLTPQKISLVFVALLSFFMAQIFDGNIKLVWKTLGSLSSSALLVPVVFGHIRPKRLNDKQFLITSLSGAFAAGSWRISGLNSLYQIDEIYIGISISFIILFSFLILSQKDFGGFTISFGKKDYCGFRNIKLYSL